MELQESVNYFGDSKNPYGKVKFWFCKPCNIHELGKVEPVTKEEVESKFNPHGIEKNEYVVKQPWKLKEKPTPNSTSGDN